MASPNPGPGQISMDVSAIPGVGLTSAAVRNSEVSGLNLSWTGANVAGWMIAPDWNRGMFLHGSHNNTSMEAGASETRHQPVTNFQPPAFNVESWESAGFDSNGRCRKHSQP